MTTVQRLFLQLQAEMVKAGLIPKAVVAGHLEIGVNEGLVANVKSQYYARVTREDREKALQS